MKPMKLYDIDLHICLREVDFTPQDKNDYLSTDEVFVHDATCNGHKLYDNDRYSLSEMVKVLEILKEHVHWKSVELMEDEDAGRRCRSLCRAQFKAA